MPELDGYEVIRRVREEAPELPLIVISGTGHINDAVRALKLGAWDYITKPIEDMNVILHAIDKALERARLIRENREYREHLEELVKQRTKELEKAKVKAEESDRLKSAFLSNMSHEIRTPMNAIIGFSSVLSQGNISKQETEEYTNLIISNGNHLLNLINDIIDISKIDSGQIKIMPRSTDINALLKELYHLFHSQLTAHEKYDVQLYMHAPAKALCAVTDKTRLRQILSNLLNNSMKFTSAGYIDFGYEVQSGHLLFYVKDTGIGIPPEKQPYIFERFRQAASSAEKLYGGAGLGLSIAQTCSQLLGGDIWLESEEGEGTTFYFTISYEPCVFAHTEKSDPSLKDISFQGEHILIAEDDASNYKYLEHIFEPYNLKISRTVTGESTVEKVLQDTSIALVLMDIQMPDKNGWEATRIIRSHQIDIPIIAQTAYAFLGDREKSLEAGCDEYLSKPTKSEDLISLVYKHLYGKEGKR